MSETYETSLLILVHVAMKNRTFVVNKPDIGFKEKKLPCNDTGFHSQLFYMYEQKFRLSQLKNKSPTQVHT